MFWSWLFGSSKTATKKRAAAARAFAMPAASEPGHEVMPAGPFDPTPPAPIVLPGAATSAADAGAAAAAGAAYLLGAEMVLSGRAGVPNGPADGAGHHHHAGTQAGGTSDLGSIGAAPAGSGSDWGSNSGSGSGGIGAA